MRPTAPHKRGSRCRPNTAAFFQSSSPRCPQGLCGTKNEIAAYEFDKLLRLDMVPPYVERRINGDLGAAVMWLEGVKSFKELGGPPTAPPQQALRWAVQIMKAKMFDNMIANTDPNLGNWPQRPLAPILYSVQP